MVHLFTHSTRKAVVHTPKMGSQQTSPEELQGGSIVFAHLADKHNGAASSHRVPELLLAPSQPLSMRVFQANPIRPSSKPVIDAA